MARTLAVLLTLTCGCSATPPRTASPAVRDVHSAHVVVDHGATRILPGIHPCTEDASGTIACVGPPGATRVMVEDMRALALANEGEAWRLFDPPRWADSSRPFSVRVDAMCAVLDGGHRVRCRHTVGVRPDITVELAEPVLELAASSEPPPRLTSCYGATFDQEHNFCARLQSGRVACWGPNAVGQRGDGTRRWWEPGVEVEADTRPTFVRGIDDAAQLALGMHHSCVLRRNGDVWCWGYNDRGQLGDGTRETRLVPTPVVALDDVVALSAGRQHTCALRADGRVLCWGAPNAYGVDAHVEEEGVFARELRLPERAVEVLAAGDYTCARTRAGRVYCTSLE